MARVVDNESVDRASSDLRAESHDVEYVPSLVDKPARPAGAVGSAPALVTGNRAVVDYVLIDATTVAADVVEGLR